MPIRGDIENYVRMEDLSLADRLNQDKEYQAHWYKFISGYLNGMSVLDAGAGVGYGLKILAGNKQISSIEGFDPLPAGDNVKCGFIENYDDDTWDAVLAIDVIEHIVNGDAFFKNLVRVARRLVFLTTPNWNFFKCSNPFHYKEYTPEELDELLKGFEYVLFTSDDRSIISSCNLQTAKHNFGAIVYV